MRKVTIGLEQGSRVQITHGVEAGEMVVIAGNLNLRDGVPVQLGKAAPPPAANKASGGDAQ